MIGMWRMETIKLVRHKRWLAVIPAFLITTFISLDNLCAYPKLELNVWDGIFSTFFNYVYFRFIVLLVFVFLVTDTITGDISSKWVYLTLSRCSDRAKWYITKVASIYSAALIYSLLGVSIVFLASLTKLPYAGSLSAFSTNPPDLFKAMGTYVIPKGGNPFTLTAQLILYTSFSLGTFALIPVTLSVIIPKGQIGMIFSLIWIFISQFFQSSRTWMKIDIIPRLVYGAFFYPDALLDFSVSGSLLYLFAVAIGSSIIGIWFVRKADF